ncbi:MAG: phospholipid carrier-dependent glycosyltransferase [Candidatus Acidiferrales bacterium]
MPSGAMVAAATVAVLVPLFANLGAIGLIGPDETRYVWIARAMAETGDWVTPRLYGVPWFEKPALYYWAAAIGFKLNLPAEWAARLPSAFAALAAAAAIGWFAWRYYAAGKEFSSGAALIAPVMFSTSVAAIGFARAATPDMLFSAAIALAMICAASVLRRAGAWPGSDGARVERPAGDLAALTLWGVFLGLGVLAKGPAAVILAGGAVGLWALATSKWRAAIRLAHPQAIAACCITALPWYALCARRNPEFLHVFIFQHNFERYLTPIFQHVQPFWFFGPITIVALLPWSVLLIAVAQEGWRAWREKSWRNSPGFFAGCWAVFPILFFSFSQSKLPSYILPAVPALALLMAISAERAFQRSRTNALTLSAGTGVVWFTLAAVFRHAAHKGPFAEIGGVVPQLAATAMGIAIVGAGLLCFAGFRRDFRLAVTVCALCVIVALETANIQVLPPLDPYLSARAHAAFLRNDLHPERIFTFELRRTWDYGLAFYFHRELPEWSLEDPEPALVLTSGAGYEAIVRAGRFRGDLEQPERGVIYVPIEPAPR